MNQPNTRPRAVRDPLVELLLDQQRTQGEKIDDIGEKVTAGFARLEEHLRDYPAVKAQVFDWRAHIKLASKVGAWGAGAVTVVVSLVKALW